MHEHVKTLSNRKLVLLLLFCSYMFSYIDRSVVGILGPCIKADLKISDTQLGLLGGFYFAFLYTLLGLPIARIAEHRSRVNIISIAMVIWSGFTAACGAAAGFAGLAFCRFGVGFGEAGCSPPAHSLVSDYFPPERRSLALSVYSLGLPVGTMVGAVAGGWLAQTFSWRTAFFVIGAPGLLVGLAIKLLIREPREILPERAARSLATRLAIGREVKEIGRVALVLYRDNAVLHMMVGMTLGAFVIYGVGQFAPAYFIRMFGLSLSQAGLISGLIGGLSAAVGTIGGGYLAGRLGQRSPVWYSALPALGLLISAPIYIMAYSADSWRIAAAILILPGIFSYSNLGPTFAAVQNSVEPSQRATATALLFFLVNLVALAGGPVFVGWVIDRASDYLFLRHTVSQLAGLTGSGIFQQACPGGIGPSGSGANLQLICRSVLGSATRVGLLAAVSVYFWASLHYFLGALAIRRRRGALV